jgi:hypothetical protein
MTDPDRAAYDELAVYTLTHGDPAFIHQHVVDAFGAQHATKASKPIGVAFALIGLCLHLERGLTGREVQQAHMRLAQRRRDWPAFDPPIERGDLTIHDVIAAEPGAERDQTIEAWCASVWQAWSASHERVRKLLREAGE